MTASRKRARSSRFGAVHPVAEDGVLTSHSSDHLIPPILPSNMTSPHPFAPNSGRRRVVLVDLDWAEADLLPELLRQQQVSVRRVAGRAADDPGIRVAELCGVPHTLELADLTREVFDVALIGERSERRDQIESLLQALGVQAAAPRAFLAGLRRIERRTTPRPTAIDPDLAELSGAQVSALIDSAIPDLGGTPAPVELYAEDPMPDPTNRLGLERLLARGMNASGAFAAALTLGRAEPGARIASSGPDDPLMLALAELAMRLDAPQVVCRVQGGSVGKAWGAWPVRGGDHRGVLMAAGADPAFGIAAWEQIALELGCGWDSARPDLVSPEHKFRNTWLTPAEFRGRVRMAVERNQYDGLRFAIHRLHFDGPPGAVEVLCRRLPDELRVTDCLCRPGNGIVLLLCAGPPAAYPHVRRRIAALWERCSGECGVDVPTSIDDERIELANQDDTEVFLAAASGWLASR